VIGHPPSGNQKTILVRSYEASRLFEIALVLVRFNYIARSIVNVVRSASLMNFKPDSSSSFISL
jgi:hypothetical protein